MASPEPLDSGSKVCTNQAQVTSNISTSHTILVRGGFQAISHDNYFRQGNLTSGQGLYKAGHVLWVEEKQQNGQQTEITAECVPQTNINNKPYRVELHLDYERAIRDGRCQCTAGIQGHCKHAAAVFYYVNSERTSASTDREQIWHEPPKSKQALYPKGLPAETIFNLPPTPAPSFTMSKEYKDQLKKDLVRFGMEKSSVLKSLKAEDDVSVSDTTAGASLSPSPVIPDAIKALFFNEIVVQGATLTENQGDFYKCDVVVSREKALDIMSKTQSQSVSPLWHDERKKRISASKAHQIANAKKPETALKYFQHVSSDHVNFQYGRTMEALARDSYQKITGNIVHLSGLFIKPCQPWICSTPDGIVQDVNGNLMVLEIKCPISCQRSKINVPWLSDIGLKENHPYYCQVQLQLYCCNLEKAHFFVFSENDSMLIEIDRNDSFL